VRAGAVQTLYKLLKEEKKCCAAVTMLGKTAELCGDLARPPPVLTPCMHAPTQERAQPCMRPPCSVLILACMHAPSQKRALFMHARMHAPSRSRA
jgi:hypothetical protein